MWKITLLALGLFGLGYYLFNDDPFVYIHPKNANWKIEKSRHLFKEGYYPMYQLPNGEWHVVNYYDKYHLDRRSDALIQYFSDSLQAVEWVNDVR